MRVKYYTADFETTTDPADCRVWAFAICDIDNPDFVEYGNDIEDFMYWCYEHANTQLYFHNLAFDGAFIIDYLENNGWIWENGNESETAMTYNTLISQANQLYQITLVLGKYRKVRIFDSMKVIP